MRKVIRHILAALVLAACLCSCSREGRVIPRNKLAHIYADMFLADSWLSSASYESRNRADTMAFYEPIFEKYGYTVEDYWVSVSHYLQDPDRFSRILNKSNALLVTELAAIRQEQEQEAAASSDGDDPDSSPQTAGQDKKDLQKDLKSSRKEAKRLERKLAREGTQE